MSVENKINTQAAMEIVTAAWALYRQNGWADRADREVVKSALSIEDMIVQPLLFTVRDNALEHIGTISYTDAEPMAIRLNITDTIREQAAADTETIIHTGVMKALLDDGNGRDDFFNSIANLLKESTINIKDFSKLCYANIVADRARIQQQIDEIMMFAVNEHIGVVGKELGITVTVLTSTHRPEWHTYNHTCISGDGHIVSFMYKKKLEKLTTANILGKVKEHRHTWKDPNLAETRLNYVKVL